MTAKFEIECERPEGYEGVGEFREPRNGEHYFDSRGSVSLWSAGDLSNAPRIILRKTAPSFVKLVLEVEQSLCEENRLNRGALREKLMESVRLFNAEKSKK